jgi:CBS domain-containing protein
MSIPITSILDRKGRDVVTVRPDTTLEEAARLLHEHNIGAAVVSSTGSSVEGILSERDIVRHVATDGPAALGHTVAQAMTSPVTTCDLHVTTDQLMATMTESRIRHLPVVEDGQLVGIVSIGDVVKAYIDDLELQRSSLERYVTGTSY